MTHFHAHLHSLRKHPEGIGNNVEGEQPLLYLFSKAFSVALRA